MFINEIDIETFRVLENIAVQFQIPGSGTANPENGNVVNVIVGVNGTGKTSLLESIQFTVLDPTLLSRKTPRFMASPLIKIRATMPQTRSITISGRFCAEGNLSGWKRELQKTTTSKIITFSPSQNLSYSEESKVEHGDSLLQTIDSKKIIGRAEFYIKEFVLGKERLSNIADPKKRSKAAIDSFNEIFEDANLMTKLSDLSIKLFNRPVFENAVGKIVTIDQLSDGEKQLYGRLIALMILNPENSIILIDEPEISLHPAWQQIIMKLYSRVGKNNQFIVATHSPHVVASVPYKNRIILHKEDGRIVPIHCSRPPSGVDINSILSEIMGVEQDPKLLALYEAYRNFVEDGKEKSPEAELIKRKLGEKENENSEFMQEMRFIVELRDA